MNIPDFSFFNDVSGPHLIFGCGIFIVSVIVAMTLRAFLKKRSVQPAAASPTALPTRPQFLSSLFSSASATPLAILLCCWGASGGLWVISQDFRDRSEAKILLEAIHWMNSAVFLIALIWFLFVLLKIAEFWLRRWLAMHGNKWDKVLALLLLRGLRFLIPYLAIVLIVPTLSIPASYHQLFIQLTSLLLIGTAGFILFQLVASVESTVLEEFQVSVKDNLSVRKIHTQVKMLKRIAVIMIILFTVASMLMVFEPVRHLGTSILASAGVAGIVIGFAAQRTLGSFLAGMQIAFTQPIRLDDVVIVEGEWGRIEEITLTYVVVLIWDQRRLVVPITYFIEKPFQNWTRVNADLLGTVFLYVDYTAPVQALRLELDRILENTKLWDRRVKGLQVTDSKERTLELRILVSAADSSNAWDLRCEVREKLVDFLQRNHPQCLPRIRLDSQEAPAIQEKPEQSQRP